MIKASAPATVDQVPVIEEVIGSMFPDNPPVVSSFEVDEATGRWMVEIYFDNEPDDTAFNATLAKVAREFDLVPPDFHFSPLADQDWVAESQKMQKPIRAGRFFVHGSHARNAIPAGLTAIEIDAGQAFGTGSHETTRACLMAIDRLARNFRPRNVLDVGTGSGILALAAARTWSAPVVATDIDPVAVQVARLNAAINGVPVSPPAAPERAVCYGVAAGLNTALVRDGAPFDLILANILMKPLCTLAPDITGALGKQGKVILSGLLSVQAPAVFAAYRNRGLKLQERIVLGQWTTLVLSR